MLGKESAVIIDSASTSGRDIITALVRKRVRALVRDRVRPTVRDI